MSVTIWPADLVEIAAEDVVDVIEYLGPALSDAVAPSLLGPCSVELAVHTGPAVHYMMLSAVVHESGGDPASVLYSLGGAVGSVSDLRAAKKWACRVTGGTCSELLNEVGRQASSSFAIWHLERATVASCLEVRGGFLGAVPGPAAGLLGWIFGAVVSDGFPLQDSQQWLEAEVAAYKVARAK